MSFSIFGYLFSIFAPWVKLPFGTETAFSAIVFYGAGYLWYKSQKAKGFIFNNKKIIFPVFLFFMIIFSTIDFTVAGHQIDMRLNHLNNYFLFYMNAFLGIFSWIGFSMILNKNRILEVLGKNSLILFAWHPVVFNYLRIIQGLIPTLENIRALIPALYTLISISVIMFLNSFVKEIRLKTGV